MENSNIYLGEKISETLTELGMSQRELSAATGIADTSLSRYIHGTRSVPSDKLVTICKVLDTSADFLLGTEKDDKDVVPFAKLVRILTAMSGDLSVKQKNRIVEILLGNDE